MEAIILGLVYSLLPAEHEDFQTVNMIVLWSVITFGFLYFTFWPSFLATSLALALKLSSVAYFSSKDDLNGVFIVRLVLSTIAFMMLLPVLHIVISSYSFTLMRLE